MGDRNLTQKLSSKDHPERSKAKASLGILAARSQENKYLWPHSPAGLPHLHTLAEAKGKGGPLAVYTVSQPPGQREEWRKDEE